MTVQLPESLYAWSKLERLKLENPWWGPWDQLRDFFQSNGYTLFPVNKKLQGAVLTSPKSPPLSSEAFGLYGDRSNYVAFFDPNPLVYPARDSHNHNVVIKVVSKHKDAEDESSELRILRILNSDSLREHPNNATVKVLEFLEYLDWHFIVMPFHDICDEILLSTPLEVLDLAEQVFKALAFLHEIGIAHLDISPENIVINHHGRKPSAAYPTSGFWEMTSIYRFTFPCRYLLMDFGRSVRVDKGRLVSPIKNARVHAAPESLQASFDPFAADVYQSARVIYGMIQTHIQETPGLLSLLQDMSKSDFSQRITIFEASARLQTLRQALDQKDLLNHIDPPSWPQFYYSFDPVPQPSQEYSTDEDVSQS